MLTVSGLIGSIVIASSAHAQVSDLAQRVGSSTLKIGVYSPDKPSVRDVAGKNILNFSYETIIQNVIERNETSTFSIGYIEQDALRIIPITVSQITRDNKKTSGYDFFTGYGVGLYAMRLDTLSTTGNTKVMPGFHFIAGLNLTTRSFIEARYHLTSHYETINPSGLNIAYGIRF